MCVGDRSFASSGGISDVFRTMFAGQISPGFSLSRTTATYLISDGLGPYFRKRLVEDINESGTYFTIRYDENTTQHVKKQMDVIVRYWSHSRKEIVVHLLSASFFNHVKAVDVARALLDTLNKPDYKLDLGKLSSVV